METQTRLQMHAGTYNYMKLTDRSEIIHHHHLSELKVQ